MKRTVRVEQHVVVEVDESKFTDEFMAEFRASFYDFHTIEDHIRHLGQLHARGLVENGDYIEAYGKIDELGIRFPEEVELDFELEEGD